MEKGVVCAGAPAFHADGISDMLHSFSVEVRSLSDGLQEDYWKFISDSTACYAFEALSLTRFLSKMSESYPFTTEVPVSSLLKFSLLCKQVFSAMFCMKTTLCA